MELSYLRYDLVDGYIHNWLVAGPQRIPTLVPCCDDGQEGMVRAAPSSIVAESGITEEPAEWSRFVGHKVKIGDYEGSWFYLRTEEDHFVDLSEVSPVRQVLRAWAYTQVDVPAAQDVTLSLTVYGSADVWVNDHYVFHSDASRHGAETHAFTAPFIVGYNRVLVRFERVVLGACTFSMALRVTAARSRAIAASPKGAGVVIPTTITPVKRRRELERTFDAAHLNQVVYERLDHILVQFDPVIGRWARGFALQLQTPDGQTYAEAEVGPRPTKEKEATLGQAYSYPDRFYHAILVPPTIEYVYQHMWATRKLPLWALDNNQYSDVAYGELAERRSEALKQAARYPDDVYAEMAKMAIGWWSVVEEPVVLRAIERLKDHQVGSVRDLLGLIGIQARYSAAEAFPEGLRVPLEEAILSFLYDHAVAEPAVQRGRDDEASSLLLYASEILAGQIFPDHIFPGTGQTGTWHRERGEQAAMAWLRTRAAGGFAAWDSGCTFAEVIAALVHLVELVGSDDLFEMATAVLDKTLYSLALNSFKGSFGSTHGVAEVPELLHGMLDATSGISRLMWGAGAFNSETTGYVSLACADDYGFPVLIQDIATDLPDALWSRERHAPGWAADQPLGDVVDKVMYRTPDYMLSSVQDYRPGERGSREHVWQATLGPAAVVFSSHPACSSIYKAQVPNYWRGNAVLPRVAQWHDVLVAIYALPDDDWMGFTHAYFPTYAFDAHALRDGWAFAQKDEGYLALTAAQGIVLLETGIHAKHELRSYGLRNIWLCQMGRASEDGTFLEFQEAVLRHAPVFDGLTVCYESLRGDALSFGWDDPLRRNGEEEPTSGIRHFDSPYGVAELPAEEMFIAMGGRALRLHLR